MKRITKLITLFILLLIMTGCSNNSSSRDRVNNGNSVNQVINNQINNTSNDNTETGNTDTEESISANEASDSIEQTDKENKKTSTQDMSDVDYDLTSMSSDMVYAMVYQMMVDPDTYVGKTFCMNGLYYAAYYEPTAQYYHYCIIQDALSCCAQGIEFVWDDGNHVYPDEYPTENSAIVVRGTFETYQEDNEEYLYCHLKDAVLEIQNN